MPEADGTTEAVTVADDTVLADLLTLRRDHNLPGWLRMSVSVSQHQVWLRFDNPDAIALWLKAMGSEAEVVVEPIPAEGVVFHSAGIHDRQPGWCVYLAHRAAMNPELTPSLAEVD